MPMPSPRHAASKANAKSKCRCRSTEHAASISNQCRCRPPQRRIIRQGNANADAVPKNTPHPSRTDQVPQWRKDRAR
eukprot:4018646-Heterocapsa_arctica.AAC.1